MNTICLIIGVVCWLFIGILSYLLFVKRILKLSITNHDIINCIPCSLLGPCVILVIAFCLFIFSVYDKIPEIKSKFNEYL